MASQSRLTLGVAPIPQWCTPEVTGHIKRFDVIELRDGSVESYADQIIAAATRLMAGCHKGSEGFVTIAAPLNIEHAASYLERLLPEKAPLSNLHLLRHDGRTFAFEKTALLRER